MSIKTKIGWINILDKLPTTDHFYEDKVMVTNGRDIELAFIQNDIFYDMGGDEMTGDITHWMYLPELPEFE